MRTNAASVLVIEDLGDQVELVADVFADAGQRDDGRDRRSRV
jgi:hypothetical protein